MKKLRCLAFLFLAVLFPLWAEAPSKELFVPVDQATLFCKVYGEGKPLVVLHGGPGLSQDYLLPSMAALAKNRKAIFYDQRGSGRSTGELNADKMNFATFVEDLEKLRKELKLGKIDLLGHSCGGFLAMQYAMKYPENIDKLILVNSLAARSEDFSQFYKEWNDKITPCRPRMDAIEKSEGFAKGDPETFAEYYKMIFKIYVFDPAKIEELSLAPPPGSALRGAQVFGLMKNEMYATEFDFRDRLSRLEIPTLVIHGDSDLIFPEMAERIHQAIPGSKYVLIKNCGHFPYIEEPEQFFITIEEFLIANH